MPPNVFLFRSAPIRVNLRLMSSTFQADFDRIALVSPEGELHNEHYHNFLLRHLPAHCDQALEIGCGPGTFARALAARSNHVLAIDLSPEMIRLAREKSVQLGKSQGQEKSQGKEGGLPSPGFSNIDFQVGDILDWDLPAGHFDCIASIATLHHLPLREMLLKMKAALKPGGVLLILDLFEPQNPLRDLFSGRVSLRSPSNSQDIPLNLSNKRSTQSGLLNPQAWEDTFLNPLALAISTTLRLYHHHRLLQPSDARAAWSAHEKHDLYPTMPEIRALCADLLPKAKVKKHLLWRYSIVWRKARRVNQL